MKSKKILTNVLCASMVVSNITPALATVNNTLTFEDMDTSASEETEVLYNKAGRYFVTIPKTISLGSDKQSPYSVKVEGDIPSDKKVYVSPIDGIKDTEGFDFYMHDQNPTNPKDDVVANVTQNKFYWNFEEVANGYEETNNTITAYDLTAGTWKGTFDFEINMHNMDDSESHKHSYTETIIKDATCTEDGEKKLTCSCGDTKTETIPSTGHNIVDGSCTDCDVIVKTVTDLMAGGDISFDMGTVLAVDKNDTLKVNDVVIPEQNFTFDKEGDYKVSIETTDSTTGQPVIININITIIINQESHTHNYSETIIKDATCTESGEKKLTCSCGDSKTEVIPSTGHTYENGKCTKCGEADPNHIHSYTETITKQAGCEEDGEKTLTCVCGDTKTEVIPSTGHDYEDGSCKNCGEAEGHIHNYVSKTFSGNWSRDYDGVSGYRWDYESATTNSIRYKANGPGTIIYNNNPDTGSNSAVTIWKLTVPISCTTQIGFKPKSTGGNASGATAYIYLNDKEEWNNKSSSASSLEYKYRTIFLQAGDNYIKAVGSLYDRIELFNVSGEYLECSECGELLDNNWAYTLNESNKTITLSRYVGKDEDVIIHNSYLIDGKEYRTKIGNNTASYSGLFYNNKVVKKIKFEPNIDFSETTHIYNMFSGCSSLTSIDLSNFDTSNVTNMSSMFSGCSSLTSIDLSNFDTSNVTDMSDMFYRCSSLTDLDVSNFDTSNVTNMDSMFRFISLTSIDLSNFDTSNVTDMRDMFSYSTSLNTIYVTQDKWSTSQADIRDMFSNCGTSSVTYK